MKGFSKLYKKYIAVGLVLALFVGLAGFAGACADRKAPIVRAALLYNGNAESRQYSDTYSQLRHSFMADFEIEKLDGGKLFLNLDKYDLIYLDPSVAEMPELKSKIVNYVKKGNSVFVPNEFADYFDLSFFGAEKSVKIGSVPTGLAYGEVSNDLRGIQEIIKDFSVIYEGFEDYDYLSQLDYGYGFLPGSAVSIADFDGVSLYGINNYGKGTVFYTNPLLPNSFHINGFSLTKTNDLQTHFSNSTAAANQLILSEFASYVSKRKYGYSIKKVLGSYGNPGMAWQLQCEDASAFRNESAARLGEMCKEYNTVPSFALSRNTYKHFSKYETDTYLSGDNGLYSAIPIDSPYFEYRYDLQGQIGYIQNSFFYLGVHLCTDEYSSPEREAEELRLHKRAFDTYAIDYDDVGASIHTRKTGEFSPYQTVMKVKEAGFKWVGCFRAESNAEKPAASAEFSLISPFFTDFEKKDFMVTNAGVLEDTSDSFAYLQEKYDLPILESCHFDFAYLDETGGRNMIEKAAAYQKANNYSFVREDQLIKSAAAAYNMSLKARARGKDILTLSSKGRDRDFALYDKDYQNAVGIKMEFSDATDVSRIGIKADVWRYDKEKNALYIGLNSKASVNFQCEGESGEYKMITSDDSHILTVNIPADITVKGGKATVRFEDDAMMQIKVSGDIKNCSDGWDVENTEGVTTITRFGSESDLSFEFAD